MVLSYCEEYILSFIKRVKTPGIHFPSMVQYENKD